MGAGPARPPCMVTASSARPASWEVGRAGLTFSLSQESGWRPENKEPWPGEHRLRFHPNLFHHQGRNGSCSVPRTAHVPPTEKESEMLGAIALEQLPRLLGTASGRPCQAPPTLQCTRAGGGRGVQGSGRTSPRARHRGRGAGVAGGRQPCWEGGEQS